MTPPPPRRGRPPYESEDADAAYPGRPVVPGRSDEPYDQYEQLDEYAARRHDAAPTQHGEGQPQADPYAQPSQPSQAGQAGQAPQYPANGRPPAPPRYEPDGRYQPSEPYQQPNQQPSSAYPAADPYDPGGPTVPQRGPGRFADPRYGESRPPREQPPAQHEPDPTALFTPVQQPAPAPAADDPYGSRGRAGRYPPDDRYAGPAPYPDPQYVDPQYVDPQYVDPQYADPQYADPRYGESTGYGGQPPAADPRARANQYDPAQYPAPQQPPGQFPDYRYADTLLPQSPVADDPYGEPPPPVPPSGPPSAWSPQQQPVPPVPAGPPVPPVPPVLPGPAGSPFGPPPGPPTRPRYSSRFEDTGSIGGLLDQPDQYGQTDQYGQPGDFVRQDHTGQIPVNSSTTANVLRSSAVMAAGTAASRVLGFVRAALLLAVLAPGGGSADAFSVANNVPNALYILLAGGVLNAVLVPQITRAAKMPDGGQEYIDRLLTAAVTLLFVATAVITAAAPVIVHIYATSHWSHGQFALAEAFALWCLPQIFWYGVYTMLGQVLNARGSFGPFMWAPVVNNVVGIAGLGLFLMVAGTGTQPLGTWTGTKILLIAGTATLGVIAQAVILIPALRAAGVTYRVRWGVRGFGLRTATRVAGWTFAAVLVQQLGYIVISQVTTAGGSLSGDNTGTGKAVYDQAFLLFMLPHSLIAVSLVTALFTRLSVSAADRDLDRVRSDLSLGLRLTGLATVVSAAAFIAIGPDITRALFPGSSENTTRGLSHVAIAMMIGLVPFSAQYLFQRVFYAFEDARTPFLIQVPVTATWAIGNLLCLVLFRHSHPLWIVVGVGVSMTVSNALGAALSIRLLRRRLGTLDNGHVMSTYLKYIGAAVAGGVVAAVLAHLVHAELGDSWFAAVIAAGVGGVALLGVYGLVLRRLKVSELDDALGPFLRRRRARTS